MGAAGVLDQTAYRGRFDDGNETGATWFGPENTDWFMQPGQTFRVRFLITVSGGSAVLNAQLQYKLNGAEPVNVTTTSPVVRAVSSAHVTHDQATTEQMAGASAYIAGRFSATGVQATNTNMSLATPQTEVEFAVEIVAADVEHLDEIEFLLSNSGVQGSFTGSLTSVPTITVAGQLARPVSDESVGDWAQGGGGEGFTLYSEVDEPAHDDDTTTIETTSGTCELGLAPLATPVARTDHFIKLRAKGSDGTGEELEVNLLQGGVTIPLLNPSILLTSGWVSYEYELAEGEAEDITDYEALSIELVGTGTGQTISVTQVFFIAPEAQSAGRGKVVQPVGVRGKHGVQHSGDQVCVGRRC